ncbi:MAG: FAD-dependent oxidoreductase [Thermocrinis sp.]|nr:FAD-dependent oxidoreductase [Thermocrinis sp.]
MISEDILYDCIIVDNGPAGLTAGPYCARVKMNTLLLEKGTIKGQIAIIDLVENYPGFPGGISGKESSLRFKELAERFGLKIYRKKDTQTGELSTLEVEDISTYIDLEPATGFLKGFVKMDDKGYIITNERMGTSVEGVFACGSCRSGSTGQAAVAVGKGCIAALEAEKYLQENF